jgi:hypothetical protein
MDMDSREERQHAHELLDLLPPAQLGAIRSLLEVMLGDDEPVTEEDRERVRSGRAWFAERSGNGIPMEDVLADFGLTMEDFPLKG